MKKNSALKSIVNFACPKGTKRRRFVRRMAKAWRSFAKDANDKRLAAALFYRRWRISIRRPDVSVAVPVYNAEPYMRRCLDSLQNQTLETVEFICVNDGSTDGSLEILREYARKDPRFKVIDRKNAGYGAALNLGFKKARGEYVTTLDPDDWIELNAYERLIATARKFDCDMVKANYWEEGSGAAIKKELFKAFGYLTPFSPLEQPKIILTTPTIWAALYRRSFLIDNGLALTERPGSSYQDAAFTLCCWMAVRSVVLMEDAFVHYWRNRADSATNSGGFVFAVCEEYEVARDYLERNLPELSAFTTIFSEREINTYRWNFNRILPSERLEFCRRWARDLEYERDRGWLDEESLPKSYWSIVQKLLDNPEDVAKLDRV